MLQNLIHAHISQNDVRNKLNLVYNIMQYIIATNPDVTALFFGENYYVILRQNNL